MIPLATWLDPKLSSPPPQPPQRPVLASTVLVPLAPLFAARHVHISGTPSAVLGDYFYHGPLTEIWAFSATPAEVRDRYQPFTITYARRTLTGWLSAVLDAGLVIEAIAEPRADEETATAHPQVADTRIAPYFLIVRARKP